MNAYTSSFYFLSTFSSFVSNTVWWSADEARKEKVYNETARASRANIVFFTTPHFFSHNLNVFSSIWELFLRICFFLSSVDFILAMLSRHSLLQCCCVYWWLDVIFFMECRIVVCMAVAVVEILWYKVKVLLMLSWIECIHSFISLPSRLPGKSSGKTIARALIWSCQWMLRCVLVAR